MFLTANNQLKKKWLIWGGAIVAILVILGFAGLDKILYMLIHNPACDIWYMGGGFLCSFAFIIGKVFSAKIWLVLTGVLLLVVLIKRFVISIEKNKSIKSKFNPIAIARDVIKSVRTNNAFLVFSSVLCAVVTTGVLKFFVGRMRPVFFDGLGVTGFNPFSFEWAFNSMPSGHAAATFAGLVMLGMLTPQWKPLTWTVAIIVGISRVYIGAHWPTDVLVGAFIGMVAADLVKHWAFKRK